MLALATGCEPLLGAAVGVKRLEPAELEALLEGPDAPMVIDVRAESDYEAGHIAGAINVPPNGLDGFLAGYGRLPHNGIVAVCYQGRSSLLAAPTIGARTGGAVASLAGGMARWQAAGLPLASSSGAEPSAAQTLPIQLELSRFEQWVVLVSGTVIKPIYMALSLLVAAFLWRARGRALARIRLGLLVFFVGEAMCALDFYLHVPGTLYPIDLLHGAAMVVMGALVPWGLYELFDEKVVHFAEPEGRCIVQRFCGSCWKRERVSCGLHSIFLFAAPALGAISLLPLCAAPWPRHELAQVFSTRVDYGLPIINQLVEYRLYPVLGALAMLLTLVRLRGGPQSVRRAERPFFVGFGLLSFVVVRFLLQYTFRQRPIWSDFWEELTELMTVLGVGLVVWVFRRQLGLPAALSRAPALTSAAAAASGSSEPPAAPRAATADSPRADRPAAEGPHGST